MKHLGHLLETQHNMHTALIEFRQRETLVGELKQPLSTLSGRTNLVALRSRLAKGGMIAATSLLADMSRGLHCTLLPCMLALGTTDPCLAIKLCLVSAVEAARPMAGC